MPEPATHRSDPAPAPSVVRHLPLPGNDAALVEAVRAGRPGAAGALFDRHAEHVRRVLVRVLGVDPEIPDLLHDVFVVALGDLGRLEDAAAIRGYLTSIAVFSARGLIRKRTRRRLLGNVLPFTTERTAVVPGPELTEALRATYRALDRLDADERIPFALRFIDGMELTEVAAACGVSLATIKRRLAKAQQRFLAMARQEPALAEWLAAGRWGSS